MSIRAPEGSGGRRFPCTEKKWERTSVDKPVDATSCPPFSSINQMRICANGLLLGLLWDVLDMSVIEMYSGGCTRSLFSLRKPLKSQCCRGHVTRDRILSYNRWIRITMGIITLFVILMLYVSESGLAVVSIPLHNSIRAFSTHAHHTRLWWEARLLARIGSFLKRFGDYFMPVITSLPRSNV